MGLFLPSQSKYFNMSVSDDEFVLDLTKMKMADLKKELQFRDLKVSGNKQELIQRLQQYLEEHEGAEVEGRDADDDALLELADNEDKNMDKSVDDKTLLDLEDDQATKDDTVKEVSVDSK